MATTTIETEAYYAKTIEYKNMLNERMADVYGDMLLHKLYNPEKPKEMDTVAKKDDAAQTGLLGTFVSVVLLVFVFLACGFLIKYMK